VRHGAFLVAIALITAAAAPPAHAQSPWQRLRDSARSWLGGAEDPAAAITRLGGSRVLLGPDVEDFRNTLLVELRDDVRKLLREARIPWGSLEVRDGNVEVRPREPSQLPLAVSALAANAGPSHDAVDVRETGEGLIRLAPTDRAIAERLNGPLDQIVEIIRRRLDGVGPVPASVQRTGRDRILVIAPGLGDPAHMVQFMIETTQLEFRLVDDSMSASDAMRNGAPASSEVLLGFKTEEPYLLSKQSTVSGHDIVDATASFDRNGRPCVDFRFSARGARAFGQLTQENIGRQIAIVLNGRVLSAPVIQTPILGGFGQITGNFTVEEAKRLALLVRAGMLPVRLVVVEKTVIPPPKTP
jgi:preprotein translocase subunit SecD